LSFQDIARGDDDRMEADFLRILDLIRRQIKSPDAANLPADASLKESLGKLCRIFFDFYEFSPAALVLVDRSGRIQAANLTLETFSGVVREELIGRSLDLSVLEADRDILYQALKKIFKSRKPASCELRLQKQSSDGSLWVRFDGIYDRDLAGHPACRAMLVDIDRQKSAESDMARLAAIVQSSEDAIIRLDPAGIITDWNPAAEKTYGYRAPEAVGRHIRLILPPGRGREVDRLIGRLRDGNEVRTFETVRRTKAGRDIAISLTVSAIRSPLGELTALATNEREITRRKRLEAERNRLIEALYQERLRLEAVFNQIPAGLYIAEAPSGKIVMNNKKAVDLLGHPLIAADGYRDYQLYGALRPDGTPYRPEDYPMTRAIIDGEVIVEEEMIYRRGDGTLTQFSVNACPIRDVEGRIFAGVLIFHDISQLKKAHDELETRVALRTAELSLTIQALENEVLEHQKARKQISIAYDALNSTTSGIIITDADLRVRFANPACLRLFGCGTPRDLIGQNAAGLFSAQQFKKFGGATLILQQSLGQTQELSVQCADGRSFPVQIAYSEVADSEGAVVGKMASLTDITARKKTAAALQESERRLRRKTNANCWPGRFTTASPETWRPLKCVWKKNWTR
jgi:PAS domain S-box-containing protein